MDNLVLLTRIREIVKLFDKDFNNKLKQHNLTINQGRILLYVVSKEEKGIQTNQHDIEERFSLSKSTVSDMINRLKQKGYIKKTNDKNMNIITSTDKGKELEPIFAKYRKEILEKTLKDISEKEKEEFVNLLNKMIKNVEEE